MFSWACGRYRTCAHLQHFGELSATRCSLNRSPYSILPCCSILHGFHMPFACFPGQVISPSTLSVCRRLAIHRGRTALAPQEGVEPSAHGLSFKLHRYLILWSRCAREYSGENSYKPPLRLRAVAGLTNSSQVFSGARKCG